jgi:hypothetical protein
MMPGPESHLRNHRLVDLNASLVYVFRQLEVINEIFIYYLVSKPHRGPGVVCPSNFRLDYDEILIFAVNSTTQRTPKRFLEVSGIVNFNL